jgi:hypothetical protein
MSNSSSSRSRSGKAKPRTLNASHNHPLMNSYVGRRALTGKAEPIRELSQGAKNVMQYASGIHAATRHLGQTDAPDSVFNNLRVGSESMHRTSQKLNKGRANVYEDRGKFPEAHYRTSVGYQTLSGDYAQHASVAELLRAGNCDMHAAVNYTYLGAHMDKDSVAAKVVNPVAKHTFAELRGSKGQTGTSRSDVIVDSWTSGKHAVLRDDTTFGRSMSPNATNQKENFTEATTTSHVGKQAFQRQQTQMAQNKPFQTFHDQAALRAENRVPPKGMQGMYSESPIMSDQGLKRVQARNKILDAGGAAKSPDKPLGGILKDLQRVQVARKMGASIGGAAKHVNENP